MEIINKKLTELKPYEKNPRNNKEAVKYVANSIKEFGFKVPIVIDKDGVIVCGHTRYLASKEIGLEEVPCIIADDLSDEQIKAYRLADNKVSEKSEWNDELLSGELEEILNIDMTKFDFNFLDDLDEEIKKEVEEPEVKFTEILGEEHNYLVLYFDNDVDWLQAESLFGIEPVKCPSTRKDGKIKKGMERIGTGRVLKGSEALERIRKEYENLG